MQETLEIKDLHVSVEGKKILNGLNLTIHKGKIHAIMGPNGAGKSTVAMTIMGHPKYKIEKGKIFYKGKNIVELEANERATLGLFLAFQYPFEIQGVNFSHFLWVASKSHPTIKFNNVIEFKKALKENLVKLGLDEAFADRAVNVGFSGGEKKRVEVLQMMMLKPEIAIMDETDSGLDIDSLKIVASAVNSLRSSEFGALVITHYQRLLNYLKPDVIHIMVNGRIVKEGGWELVEELEKDGYANFIENKTESNRGET